ncbi:uncharacterized protein LOC128224416 [Mya arenaria]|uniref:uncharacterized protein LOC128224416 n=1 Tax=Mya arenaria TaxID=6604 RepID=UPI0022E56C59|nr:uncharacterized protein LOC128224416 [Mya arenaria]
MSFNNTLIPTYFRLESFNTFDQTLCGSYTCIDLDTRLQDSIKVSFKDFANETFNIYEGDEVVFITTSCSFAATLSEMQSSWFIGDSNTSISLRNVGFNKTDNCVNATCDGSPGQRFTVGLNFTNQDEYFASSFVRVEIVHPLFPFRPLSWRSSKKYPVKEAKGGDDTHPSRISTGTIVGITLLLMAFCAICMLTFVFRRRKKRKNKSYKNKESATPDTPSEQLDINKPSVTAANEQDLFSFNEQSKLASVPRPYLMWKINAKTCKSVIEKELKTDDNTDCFICIISSRAKPNATVITDGYKEESIGHLASLDNNIISENLVGKPKVLIFDLYKPDSINKGNTNEESTSQVAIHRDWLLVFVRNAGKTSFLTHLREEMVKMHDKLDFVTMLERVKGRNVNMKIVHRMPGKFFLNAALDSMQIEHMSHYNIKGYVRCSFFGNDVFDKQTQLESIEVDRENVFKMNDEFLFSSHELKSEHETMNVFRNQLNNECGCHIFVFSSHGTPDGIITKNNEIVRFTEFIKEIAKRPTNIPVVLVFDCCRYEENRGDANTREQQYGELVSVEEKALQMSNIIVVYAAIHGYKSSMDRQRGSYFIQEMCKVFRNHRLNLDFFSMMECANKAICNNTDIVSQTCVEIESQLTKKLFLFRTVPDQEAGKR